MKGIVMGCTCAVIISVFAGLAWAQATAQITGTVRDQTGAVLPGVEITATQTETGIARSTITNETGSYVLPNLATGPYRLEAALPGFRSYVQTGIVLQVNSNPVINPTLKVGQVTEQIEVQANAALVETRASGVGQVVENERILELPLNGRQVTDLITLAGAAVNTATPASNSRVIKGRASVAVAGGFGWSVAYILDGVTHNDPYDNLSLPFPFPDALQEFKVETGGLSAQNGMHTGAAVTSVTKSGTNDLHGDLFEFVRNDLFNARNYFAATNNTLKRNQFGGTIGGPILNNKLFFFGGYQGTTIREDPANNQAYVPTVAMTAGDFTAVTSPACNSGRQVTLRAPFVNNRVDPAVISKAALNVANKLPKSSDACGLVTYGVRNVGDDHQVVSKIDYQWSNKQSIFGRVIETSNKVDNPFSEGGNLLNTISPGYDNLGQSYALGDTYLLGPSTVNAVRLAVNRTAINRMAGQFFEPRDVGINVFSSVPKYTQLTVTGGFNIGGSGPAKFRTTTYQLTDDVNLARGTHQIGFGANFALWRSNGYAQRRPPTLSFDGSITGLGNADFLLGRLRTLDQSATLELVVQEWYSSLYAQDTWKVTPRLTFNYGIRWEPFSPQVFKKGNGAYTFDHDRFLQGIKSTVYKNAPSGVYYSGDPGSPGNAVANKRWMDFGPRVGLAWDPAGNGVMSVRASYSMGFERQTLAYRQTTATNPPPWGARIVLDNPGGGLENPWQTYPGGNPYPLRLDANSFFPAFGIYTNTPWDIKPTTVHAWDLSIQRQVGSDWLVSTSYLGRQITHVWTGRELNYGIYFPGGPCTLQGVTYNPCSSNANLNQRRRFSFERPQEATAFGGVNEIDDGGTQSYHGMLLSVQRSAGRGATISGNYTLSHCIGMPGNGTSGADPGSGYVDFNNRDFDRGNCEADRRHIFNLTAVAETPRFADSTLRALAAGWRLSGIFKRASGDSLTIQSGQDRALTGMNGQRPNQILASPYLDRSGRPNTQYLNPAAFAQPALGTLGNMGRSNVVGPGVWQFDLALSRVFNFRENQRLEFRAEAYNIMNHFQPSTVAPLSGGAAPVVTTNINTTNTFGQIRTAGDPRILQFALKYIF